MISTELKTTKEYERVLNTLDTTEQQLIVYHMDVQRVCKREKFLNLVWHVEHLPIKPAIIALSETWFLQKETGETGDPICLYRMCGYQVEFSSRTEHSAGIAMYVRNGILFETLEKSNERVSFIHAVVRNVLNGGEPLYITTVYMPNVADHAELRLCMERLIMSVGDSPHLIMGDFNIDLLRRTRVTKDYETLFESYGYEIGNGDIITRPDRGGGSVIDHSWYNRQIKAHFVLKNDISDHNGSIVHIGASNVEDTEDQPSFHVRTDWFKFEKEIKLSLSSINRDDFEALDVNCMVEVLLDKIQCTIQNSETHKRRQKRKTNSRPWLSDRIISLSNEKSRLLSLRKRRPGDPILHAKIIKISKVLSNEKSRAEKDYISEQLGDGVSTRNQWRVLNNLMGRKKKDDSKIKKISTENCSLERSLEISSKLNEFFVDIGPQLQASVRLQSNESPSPIQANWSTRSMMLFETDETEIMNLIRSLSDHKAQGVDKISNKYLKACSEEIAWYVSVCINKSMSTGTYPDYLKIARVVPIFKGGKKDSPNSYRPISVLSGLNKIFELALKKRLTAFLERENILYPYQFGYRQKSGTVNACTEVLNFVYEEMDKKSVRVVSGLFIDLSKAFDTISHELLLKKLNVFGVRGQVLNLFESYLSNRKQCVDVDGEISGLLDVKCGVPQGSVLGPIFFLLFLNDVERLGLRGKVFIYADDTAIFYPSKNVTESCENIQHDLNVLDDYFGNNLLVMNLSKTKIMHFQDPKTVTESHTPVILGGVSVELVKQFKYLGLVLDSYLKWGPHSESICKKISPAVATLYKLKKILPTHAKKKIYHSLIHSRISYMSQVWGAAAGEHVNRVQIMQNRALKQIYNLPHLTESKSLYLIYAKNVLPVKGVHVFNTLKYVQETLHRSIRSNLSFLHVINDRTRPRYDLAMPKFSTSRGEKRLTVLGVKYFNELPVNLKMTTNLKSFLKELKSHFGTTECIERFLD